MALKMFAQCSLLYLTMFCSFLSAASASEDAKQPLSTRDGLDNVEVNAAMAIDARLDAFAMMQIIEKLNRGDYKAVCDIAEMHLVAAQRLLGENGLKGMSKEDAKRNASVVSKIDDYFRGKGCVPAK